jgi:predicted phage tail protein
LSGYRVFYGASPTSLTQSVEVTGSSATGKVITGLAPGTYFFAVAAVNSSGIVSDPSNAVSMTVK